MDVNDILGAPYVYSCEADHCKKIKPGMGLKARATARKIMGSDHWLQKCDQPWFCKQGHTMHHAHTECAA